MEISDYSFGSTCEYEVGSIIGRGAFGTVRKARITEKEDFSGENEVAEKEVILQPEPPLSNAARAELLSRMEKMITLKHDHLVPYHKVSLTKESERVMRCSFLMDFYADGDLAEYLKNLERSSGKMDLSTTNCFAMQLADGVAYLHKNKFIHGDIKPSNVLIKHRDNRHSTLLIGDLDDIFQMQRSITSARDTAKLRGTFSYMSPEMLRKLVQGTCDERIGRKSDIWSLGCVVLELANLSCGRAGKWLYNRITNESMQITAAVTDFRLVEMILGDWVPFIDGSVPPQLSECIQNCFCNVSKTCDERISATNFRRRIETVQNCVVSTRNELVSPECYCAVPKFEEGSSKPFERDPEDEELWDMDRMSIHDAFLVLGLTGWRRHYGRGNVCTELGRLGNTGLEERLLRHAVEEITLCDVPSKTSLLAISRSCAFFKKLESLQHNSLLPLHGSHFLKDDGISQGSHLDRFLDKKRGTGVHPDISLLISFAAQTADGLQFLHRNGIFCGVLDPASVYVTSFGNSHNRFVIDLWKSYEHLTTPELFRKYKAPEVLKGTHVGYVSDGYEYYDGKNVGNKADIWSFGVIIILLANDIFGCLTKQWLYNENTHERRKFPSSAIGILKVFDEGFKPYIHRKVPNFLATYIRHKCCFDARYPPSADEMLPQISSFCMQLQSTSNSDGLAWRPEDPVLHSNSICQTASSALKPSSPPADDSCGIRRNVQNEVIVLFPSAYSPRTSRQPFTFHPDSATLRPIYLLKTIPLPKYSFITWNILNNGIIFHYNMDRNDQLQVYTWDIFGETWAHVCTTTVSDRFTTGFSTAVGNSVFCWRNENKLALQELNLLDGEILSVQPIPMFMRRTNSKRAKLIPFGSKIICCAHSRSMKWILCFDTVTKKWESFPDLPEPRKGYAAVIVERDLYILGGWTGHNPSEIVPRSCMKLNMVTRSWNKVCDLTYPRYNHCAAACNDQIYVFGGWSRSVWDSDSDSDVSEVSTDTDPKNPPIESLDRGRNVWAVIKLHGENQPDLDFYDCGTLKEYRFKPVSSMDSKTIAIYKKHEERSRVV